MPTKERASLPSKPIRRASRSGPLVSVIIPARDAAPFIGAAIESACRQTYENIEVLVVDDGSEDRTAAIVRAMALQDRRIRLFRQLRTGVGAARNRGIVESRGEYIAPLDADDVWFPRKIAEQVRCFRNRPDAGLAYAWTVYIDERGRLTGGYYAHDLPGNVPAALIFKNLVGCGSVPLIHRKCFAHAGMYNVEYAQRDAQGCEDLDLYLRIAERYEFLVVKEFLVGYRRSSGCMSARSGAMARSFYFAMRDCRRRRPDVPWKIFRWSLARQYFCLHIGAAAGGRPGTGITLLLAAAWFDPAFLVRRRFYERLIAVAVPGLARVARRWRADGRRPDAARPVTLAGMMAQRAARPFPLFETFEKVYQRRLRFTERRLHELRRGLDENEQKESSYAPLREPPG